MNGKIYAVDNSTGVTEWDPVTLALLKSYNLVQVTGSTQYGIEDIAVAANGDLYTLNEDSQIYHYDSDGNQLSITKIADAATSIEILSNGEVLLGSTGNRFTLTNIDNLSDSTTFTFPGVGTVFAAFAVPEPTSLMILVPCGLVMLMRRRSKNLLVH